MPNPSDKPAWESSPYPGALRAPTMLTPREIDYLHWLGRDFHDGSGRMIELGCFLGGSTLALATGLRHNPQARTPMLTYDAFVMDEHGAAAFDQPYNAGERFRPLFDIHTRDVADLIDVREGWLPESLPTGRGAELYPEQEPVDVLFVDAAKSWGVHETVLRAFGPHLTPGRSLLVQQDFKNHWVHWIPLHMHELRACFEPAHDVPGSATLAFRYVGGLPEALGDLSRVESFGAAQSIIDRWASIDEWWLDRGTAHIRLTLWLNRATHLASRGFVREACDTIETFRHALPSLATTPALQRIAEWEHRLACNIVIAASGQDSNVVRRLLDDMPLAPAGDDEEQAFIALWREVAERVAERGWRRIWLYGAGRHTRRLLATGWPWGLLEIEAVVDDGARVEAISGHTVVKPSRALTAPDAVILSSDQHEALLHDAAKRALDGREAPIIRVYDRPIQTPATAEAVASG